MDLLMIITVNGDLSHSLIFKDRKKILFLELRFRHGAESVQRFLLIHSDGIRAMICLPVNELPWV